MVNAKYTQNSYFEVDELLLIIDFKFSYGGHMTQTGIFIQILLPAPCKNFLGGGMGTLLDLGTANALFSKISEIFLCIFFFF